MPHQPRWTRTPSGSTAPLIKWPGAVKGTRFRLYHSPSAAIVATPATKVTGAAGSIALDVFVGALPAGAAARFK
jgi:pullulanase